LYLPRARKMGASSSQRCAICITAESREQYASSLACRPPARAAPASIRVSRRSSIASPRRPVLFAARLPAPRTDSPSSTLAASMPRLTAPLVPSRPGLRGGLSTPAAARLAKDRPAHRRTPAPPQAGGIEILRSREARVPHA